MVTLDSVQVFTNSSITITFGFDKLRILVAGKNLILRK